MAHLPNWLAPKNRAEVLRVYCPARRAQSLEQLQKAIDMAVGIAKERAEKDVAAKPSVLLFPEFSADYDFDIKHDSVRQAVDRMMKRLPRDMWIAVAFDICELHEGKPQHMGYFFARETIDFQPKRSYTYDDVLPMQFYAIKNSLPQCDLENEWMQRGRQMQSEGRPFLSLLTPLGDTLEYRICRDVGLGFPEKQETIALVSASGIIYADVASLSERCQGVIVNDFTEKFPLVESRDFRQRCSALCMEGFGWLVTVRR